MRVLVTGAGGLVGGRLAATLAADGCEVVAGFRSSPPPQHLMALPLDIERTVAIPALLAAARCDAVVHCAAFADADACERDPERARRVNTEASVALAGACRRRGAAFVLVSTDLVFDGSRGGVAEADAPRPLMLYGRSKVEAERAVSEACPAAAVVRIALVAGLGHGRRGTASEAIAWALTAGRRLRLYTDQHRTPVDPESVARAVGVLLRRGARGTFHLGGPERVSRFELGQRVARVLALDGALIEPAEQGGAGATAPRPADVSLDSSRARAELGFAPPSLDDMIRAGRRESEAA